MAHTRSNSVSRLICGSGWDCSRWSTPDVGVLLVDVAVRVFGHSESGEKRDDAINGAGPPAITDAS